MTIHVRCGWERCQGGKDQHEDPIPAEGQLTAQRDATEGLTLNPPAGWRLVEIRRTIGNQRDPRVELYLACSEGCENQILARSREAGQ